MNFSDIMRKNGISIPKLSVIFVNFETSETDATL